MTNDPLEFEVTDNERRHLAVMLKSPGYLVLKKIWKSYMDAATQSALLTSKSDPLGNAEAIAQKWAYVGIAEQILENMDAGVQFEIEMLRRAEQPKPDPADLAKRRRLHASFGSLSPLPEE